MHDEVVKKLKYLRDLEKLKASGIKDEDYTSDLDKDSITIKGEPKTPDPVTKIKGMTQHIDTKSGTPIIKGADFTSKIQSLLKSSAGKKMIGALPLAGAGMAALSGEPAMAVEELAGDIPVIGQAYEAIKPSESGNPEEERQMIGDRNIQGNYAKSQAYRDARGISEDEALIQELEDARKQPVSKNLQQGKPQRNIFSGLRNLLGK
jgi:hypothetical protein